jgi:hypothetical protein
MKKIYILMIAILIVGIAKGQWQNQATKPNVQDIINKTLSGKIPQDDFSKQIKSQKASKSVSWNFDTIVAYDINNNPSMKVIQTFDNSGNILTEKSEEWQFNTWVNNYKESYSYDTNGNMLSKITESWQSNTWINLQKRTYTYNTNEKLLTIKSEDWQNNNWINGTKNTYTYDINDNNISIKIENWQNNAWVNIVNNSYTYDISGNLLTYLIESWQNNGWTTIGKTTYTYNSNEKLLISLYEQWQNNNWVNYSKYTYNYNITGNILTYISELWQNNSWVNDKKNSFTYDASGNILNNLMELWQNNTWKNYQKCSYTYDSHGNSITGNNEGWFNNNWALSLNGALDVYSFKNSILLIVNIARYEAHFVSFTNGINETTAKQLNLYPNPANNSLTLNLSQQQELQNANLSIYDIQGKQLLHQNITEAQTQLDISSFAKGIYIVKLQTDKETLQSKFIKE